MISRKTVISVAVTLVLAAAGLALTGCPDKAGGTTGTASASATASAAPSASASAKSSSSGSGW